MKVVSGMVAVGMMAASAVYGAEATLSLDVASAYVFRGVTFNDGAVLQPGVKVGGLGGLTIGVWGNLDLDDYGGALEKGELSEIDIYASYALPCTLFDLSVGYTEYTYPMGGGNADREVGLSVGKSVGPVDLAAVLYYGIDGGIEKSLYAELSAGTGFELGCIGVEFGAAVGYVDPDKGKRGFSHVTASAGLSYGPIAANVTYVSQMDDDVLPDVQDGGGYDVDVVGKLSLVFSF